MCLKVINQISWSPSIKVSTTVETSNIDYKNRTKKNMCCTTLPTQSSRKRVSLLSVIRYKKILCLAPDSVLQNMMTYNVDNENDTAGSEAMRVRENELTKHNEKLMNDNARLKKEHMKRDLADADKGFDIERLASSEPTAFGEQSETGDSSVFFAPTSTL